MQITYGFTLLIAATLCAGTAHATGSGQKSETEYRKIVPRMPLSPPNAAQSPAPEARVRAEAKAASSSSSQTAGGKVRAGRSRTGNGKVSVRGGFEFDADGGF